jgi:hypothetical protein
LRRRPPRIKLGRRTKAETRLTNLSVIAAAGATALIAASAQADVASAQASGKRIHKPMTAATGLVAGERVHKPLIAALPPK